MRLDDRDVIVAAWAERASGPGWSNRLVWLLVRDEDGELRLDSLQPDEYAPSATVTALFDVSAACATAMLRAVKP